MRITAFIQIIYGGLIYINYAFCWKTSKNMRNIAIFVFVVALLRNATTKTENAIRGANSYDI